MKVKKVTPKKNTEKSHRITIHAHKKCYEYLEKRMEEFGERTLPKTVMEIIRREKILRERDTSYGTGMKSFSEKIEIEMRDVERKCESNSHEIRRLKFIETETNLNRENILTMNEEIKFLQSMIDKNLQTECLLNKQIQELERELNGISPDSLKRKDLVKKMEKELAPFVERTVIDTLKSIDRMLLSDESPAEGDYAIILSHRNITETAAAEIQSDYQNDNEQKSETGNPDDKKGEDTDTISE